MKKTSKTSVVIGVVLLLVLGGVTVYVLQKELDTEKLALAFQTAKYQWLTPAIVCMLLYFVGMSRNIRAGLSIFGDRCTLFQPMRYTLTGFFFSSVTPSSTGGQPAQLFFMTRDGIHLSHGTFALLLELLSFVSASVLLGASGLGIYWLRGGALELGGGVIWLYFLGFAINLIAIVAILCFMFSKQSAKFFLRIILWFSEKVLKKPEKRNSILRSIAEYRHAAKYLKHHSDIFTKMLLTAIGQLAAYHSIPFFCCLAMGGRGVHWIDALSLQSFLYASVSSLPFPGAAGITEGGFAILFTNLLGTDLMASTMILSRLCSFVLPLIISGIAVLFEATVMKLIVEKRTQK